jgi:hypothetical protein
MEEVQEKSKQIRRSKAEIHQLVLGWQQSGKSKSLFCKEHFKVYRYIPLFKSSHFT